MQHNIDFVAGTNMILGTNMIACKPQTWGLLQATIGFEPESAVATTRR